MPLDLHLLLNTLASSAALRSAETWLPMCLPKFNPGGFVHAYISFLLEDVGLVFVSADREAFEELRIWKDAVLAVSFYNSFWMCRTKVFKKLESDKTLSRIEASIPRHAYSVCEVAFFTLCEMPLSFSQLLLVALAYCISSINLVNMCNLPCRNGRPLMTLIAPPGNGTSCSARCGA